MLTPAQTRAFQRGIAVANEVRPGIERLEAVAAAYPPLQVTVDELKTRMQQLQAQCEAALAADQAMGVQ